MPSIKQQFTRYARASNVRYISRYLMLVRKLRKHLHAYGVKGTMENCSSDTPVAVAVGSKTRTIRLYWGVNDGRTIFACPATSIVKKPSCTPRTNVVRNPTVFTRYFLALSLSLSLEHTRASSITLVCDLRGDEDSRHLLFGSSPRFPTWLKL